MQLPKPLRPRTKLAKSRHAHALRTLVQLSKLGEATPQQVLESFEGARHSMSQTVTSLWDLFSMGLVEGQGQSPEYARGVPETYSVTQLGLVVLSWIGPL